MHFYAKQPINYTDDCVAQCRTLSYQINHGNIIAAQRRETNYLCACVRLRARAYERETKCCFNRRRMSLRDFLRRRFLHSAGAEIAVRAKLRRILPHFSSPNCCLGCNLGRIALNGEKFVANGAKNKGTMGGLETKVHSEISTKHLECKKVLLKLSSVQLLWSTPSMSRVSKVISF